MTVGELIAVLQELPPDLQVIMQKDAEGNGYSPLCHVSGNEIYEPDSPYSGEVLDPNWTWDESGFDSEEEWEEYKKSKPRCCVLSPIN